MPRLTAEDYLSQATSLPPAPRVLPQLLVLLSQPNTDSGRLVDLISRDPHLTLSVLRLCNSAYLGNSMPAGDLQEAVTRLGFRQVYQMVATISGASLLAPAQPGYGIGPGELWRHSVTAAIAAQIAARHLQENETLAFTATLLHDLGKAILSDPLVDAQAHFLKAFADDSQITLTEVETQLLGVEHAHVGSRLLARWQFPESLIHAVRGHHDPSAAAPHERLAALVYLGNLIACLIGHCYGYYPFALRHQEAALKALNLGTDDVPRFMIKTLEQYEIIQALFQTNAPQR